MVDSMRRKDAGKDQGLRLVSVRLPAELVKRLKVRGVETEQSVQDMMADALETYLARKAR